jgi:hypothetical protein
MLSLALFLATAPLDARFVLVVSGLPVAELSVRVEGARYQYEATHFLDEGPRVSAITLPLESGAPVPEVLALARRPPPGCRDVLEERHQRRERLCVDEGEGAEVHGTLAGQAFEARYDAADMLEVITVGAARWEAVARPVRLPPRSPFKQGVPVPSGRLELRPAVPGARWLTRPPRGAGVEGEVGRTRCLALARALAAELPGATVAVGLVVEDGVAFPHAWVNAADGALDPSVLPDDDVLRRRRYLEVPAARAGRFFLELFDGSLRLVAQGR